MVDCFRMHLSDGREGYNCRDAVLMIQENKILFAVDGDSFSGIKIPWSQDWEEGFSGVGHVARYKFNDKYQYYTGSGWSDEPPEVDLVFPPYDKRVVVGLRCFKTGRFDALKGLVPDEDLPTYSFWKGLKFPKKYTNYQNWVRKVLLHL